MKNKTLKSRAAVLAFTFLFSENILYNLFYSGRNPIISFLVISVALMIFTKMICMYFQNRERIKGIRTARFFAISTGIFMIVPFCCTVQAYVKTLGVFSSYYATIPAVVFAAVSAAFLGIYCACKGEKSVYGFARMIFAVSVVWVLSGAFGLLFTKKFVPLSLSFGNFSDTNWLETLKSMALITFDTVFMVITLTDNRLKSERKELCSGICIGTYVFVAVSGINLLKNLFIFGADFAKRLDSPDLAAIQLIPMFELPELGVIVNTFSVTIRGAVYICALMFILKDTFAESYNNKKVLPVIFAVFGMVSVILCLFAKTSFISSLSAVCVVLSTVCGIVLFGYKEKI